MKQKLRFGGATIEALGRARSVFDYATDNNGSLPELANALPASLGYAKLGLG